MPSCVNCHRYIPREDARPFGGFSVLCEYCYQNVAMDALYSALSSVPVFVDGHYVSA